LASSLPGDGGKEKLVLSAKGGGAAKISVDGGKRGGGRERAHATDSALDL